MLYTSLILIAAGIFFIIYTLLIKTKNEPEASRVTKTSRPAKTTLKDEKPERPDKKIFNDKYDKSLEKAENQNIRTDALHGIADVDIKEETAKDSLNDTHREVIEKKERKEIERSILPENNTENKTSNIFAAVLYEDSSNIIDYDNNDSTIDLTLNEYRKIKRLSAGHIEIAKDGINFRAGKKVFRFDYHQIANIKTGSNFIVVLIKKSRSSRLFLYKDNPDLSARAKQTYNNYSSNVFHL